VSGLHYAYAFYLCMSPDYTAREAENATEGAKTQMRKISRKDKSGRNVRENMYE